MGLLSLASGAGSMFSGLKMAAILIAIIAGAGSLAYITHALTSGAAAKVEAEYIAKAAQRSLEAERRTGRSLAAAEREKAEGKAEVAALRQRADRNAARARAARAEAAKARAAIPGCPPIPEPMTCPADLPVVQQ